VEIEKKYFAYLERQRLYTNNFIPHRNLLCLMRLVRKGIIKAIITTNYDRYVMATFLRYGQPFKCVLNPLLSGDENWNSDGYYSAKPSANEIPLWKIHGDLGFVRMDDCCHIFRLPSFVIDRVVLNNSSSPICCHNSIYKENGDRFRDPSLTREHPSISYQHHIDFDSSRDIFQKESRAALKQLDGHLKKGGLVLVLGMSFNPVFTEELVLILSKPHRTAPLVYVVASQKKITFSENELLSKLNDAHEDYILVNEINSDKRIDHALIEILKRSGETDIEKEYQKWITEKKWWVKV
jgi:hypothetical protein